MENNDHNKVIEYWGHVHRLLNSVELTGATCKSEDLKFFINTITSSHLLNQVECHCLLELEEVEENPVPLTTWILQRLLHAAEISYSDRDVKKFYVDAQAKLLKTTFTRSNADFFFLIDLYFETIYDIISVEEKKKFYCLMRKEKFDITSITLDSLQFEIKYEREKVQLIELLILVLVEIRDCIQYVNEVILKKLWLLFHSLSSSTHVKLFFFCLPLLSKIIESKNYPEENLFVGKVMVNLPRIIPYLTDSNSLNTFTNLWSSLKSVVELKPDNCHTIVQNLLHNKGIGILEEMTLTELGYYISKCSNRNVLLDSIRKECKWEESTYILQSFVVDDLKDYLSTAIQMKHIHPLRSKKSVVWINVEDRSTKWNELLKDLNNLFEAAEPLVFVSQLVRMAGKIFEIISDFLNKKHERMIKLNFFGNYFSRAINECCTLLDQSYVRTSCHSDMAWKTMTAMLNLPEVELCSSQSLHSVVNYLEFRLKSFNTLHTEIKINLIKSIRCMPPGITDAICLRTFREACNSTTNDVLTSEFALKSISYFSLAMLPKDVPAAQIIADFFLQAVLSEIEQLQLAALKASVDLMCIISGSGYLVSGGDVACCECDGVCIPNGESEISSVEPHMTKLLKPLFSSPFPSVRKQLLMAVPRLSVHLKIIREKTLFLSFLHLIQDPDQIVVQAFNDVATTLIFGKFNQMQLEKLDKVPVHCKNYLPLLNICFDVLKTELKSVMTKEQGCTRAFSLLNCIKKIACFPVREVLKRSLFLIIQFISYCPISLDDFISKIAVSHKTTTTRLYYSLRPELCQFVAARIILNFCRLRMPVYQTLTSILSLFPEMSASRFFQASEQFIVPQLIIWAVKHNLKVCLEEFAVFFSKSTSLLITNNFHSIFCEAWRKMSEEEFKTCQAFIEKESNFAFLDLITQSQKQLIHELLFNYHENESKILIALQRVLNTLSNNQLPADLPLTEQVAFGLESRFVGYLLFVVGKFTKDIVAESEQVQAVKSLTSVLRLMGHKYITLVSRKVLSTLITALSLNKEIYAQLHCQCWHSFVKSVDCQVIGPLIPTIVISVLSLLDDCPNGVSQILTELLVEHDTIIAPYFSTLTFIPNHPSLVEVNAIVTKYTNFSRDDIKDRLVRETSLSTHETVAIRIEGLKALSDTLKSFSKEVPNLINGSDEPHGAIISLWDALIMCCRDQETKITVGAAQCLGQLGALDPGLLPRKLKPNQSLPLSAHMSDFGLLALRQLVHHFQIARTSVDMDAFALAIQELLKIYEITSDSSSWSNFSESEKSLMTPMLTSRYKINAPKCRDIWPEIIFITKEANSHISWASSWAGKLIANCKDNKSQTLFRACEPCMKRDPAVLQLFLRYILVQIIIQGSAEEAGVYKEINAVIDYCLSSSATDETLKNWNLDEHVFISPSEGRMCAMTIFFLLDFVQFWIRQFLVKNVVQSFEHLKKPEYLRFKEFLSKIDVVKIAKCNYEMCEFPRTVQYLEDLIIKDSSCLPEHLPVLSKTFALYGDLDNVCGASALQQAAPSVEDQLFYHQVSKQLEEVRITYERLCEEGELTANQIEEMVQCYLRLGEPSTALNIIQSYEIAQPHLCPLLSERKCESMLKLGKWDLLKNYLNSDNAELAHGWYKDLAVVLSGIYHSEDVEQQVYDCRLEIINNFKSLAIQSANEQQLYPCLLRFQILSEIERVVELLNKQREMDSGMLWTNAQALMEEWEGKINLLQSDGESLEQLFGIRRNLLCILVKKLPKDCSTIISNEIGEYWNKSASLARKGGCYHQAYNYILNAEKYAVRSTFIEKAQLFWDKGDQETCLSTLSRGLRETFSDGSSIQDLPSSERVADRKVCAEAKLLFAIYNEETSNCDSYTNMTNYQEAFDVCRQLEKTQVHLGQCLDRVVNRMDDEEQESSKACDLRVMIVNHFGKSLLNGCEYIYQTVPRMLTIWLDLGENLKTPDRLKAMQKINKLIQQFNEKLPPFVLMTALTQLLSRIGHPNREVFVLLKNILSSLIRAFPQQCLWAIQTLAKSSIPERCLRYREVIQDMSLRRAEICKLIEDMTLLCEKLNKLTNKNLPADAVTRGLSVSSVVRELPLLFNSTNFSSIILPITKCCRITLPRTNTLHTHIPFPKNPVTIVGIKNELTVLPSLQRPRKISFIGSDGNVYDILCKPKDDLRRDARLMEFNNIVNMYLHRDPEARARHLHIRTYVVIPLGESGGLLEWVPNLVGLRPALLQLYKQHGLYTPTRDVKKLECLVRDPIPKKREVFLQKLLPAHPPIFHEWFRVTFSDPAGWYVARQAFTRTTAVMSMVGYILGLGDRHGENILFDCESGDTVHVDFNCLFNKGENFDWKERVPFRLTHNMVIAMGPCGVEGAFRKACEASMRVLRAQDKTLMSVLTPFAYDPSGSWGKNKEIGQQDRDQKISEALEELNDIEKRLKGSLRVKQKNNTFFLSVEGLVRALIADATNVDNLCQMYLGWGAYL